MSVKITAEDTLAVADRAAYEATIAGAVRRVLDQLAIEDLQPADVALVLGTALRVNAHTTLEEVRRSRAADGAAPITPLGEEQMRSHLISGCWRNGQTLRIEAALRREPGALGMGEMGGPTP